MSAFLTRNTSFSIRKPEATSLSGATSFNKTNVQSFYTKLPFFHHSFFYIECRWNWCTDRYKRQVGSVTSGERGTNITLLVAVSATGSSIPPMFILPRKRFQDHFIRNGPTDCDGAGNSSGWITNDKFFIFIRHFIKNVRPSKESPALLVLDNYSLLLSVPTLHLAKENGATMLSFPPHCSTQQHKMHGWGIMLEWQWRFMISLESFALLHL